MIRVSAPYITDDDIKAVVDVLHSGMLAFGRVGEEFERELARYLGVKHAVAVCNGTAALYLSMRALGVGPGDEVVVPDFTFFATASTVLHAGATPVLVDIEPDTYTIDVSQLERVVSDRTKAIVPVHLYGHPADLDGVVSIARERNIYVVEDCAQALGAEFRGRKVGGLGYVAAFSFYPTKNITTGEGGAVTTDVDYTADLVKLLRSHGQKSRYYHVELGWNMRMTDIGAALGLSQLKRVEEMIERRRKLARVYLEELNTLRQVRLPVEKPWARHTYNLFTIWVEDSGGARDRLADFLRKNGVETAIHYPTPLHRQPVLTGVRKARECCRVSDEASKHVLSLPLHPGLREEDVLYVSKLIKSFFRYM
ncbi:MAG: DegT/DnrJ/EryC1/StrS family aminotransferase [Sulfolobales archaeon]|nr:DegT/DnrJ/EryC1/StrS family aminotransferase [Sulfolobales archaeon]MDW8082833.1 DegT/DnrJ/EryC1/StrS family aminotransferase [Sulfolobales archaeon]